MVIEDDVEIGANVTIDRATFGRTHVKQGTKIDNLVQIAHNVTIGEHGIIVAQVGIAGSTSIGKQVMIGGQAGLIDHLTIGDRVMIAAGAGIEKDVEPGVMMSGRPAKQRAVFLRTHVLVQHLPELYKQVSNLENVLPPWRTRNLELAKPRNQPDGETGEEGPLIFLPVKGGITDRQVNNLPQKNPAHGKAKAAI